MLYHIFKKAIKYDTKMINYCMSNTMQRVFKRVCQILLYSSVVLHFHS